MKKKEIKELIAALIAKEEMLTEEQEMWIVSHDCADLLSQYQEYCCISPKVIEKMIKENHLPAFIVFIKQHKLENYQDKWLIENNLTNMFNIYIRYHNLSTLAQKQLLLPEYEEYFNKYILQHHLSTNVEMLIIQQKDYDKLDKYLKYQVLSENPERELFKDEHRAYFFKYIQNERLLPCNEPIFFANFIDRYIELYCDCDDCFLEPASLFALIALGKKDIFVKYIQKRGYHKEVKIVAKKLGWI